MENTDLFRNAFWFDPEVVLKYRFDLQLFAAEDEGRTEEPTEYKKKKAREEGNVPKSQELSGITVFLMGFWTISLIGGFIFDSMIRIMKYYLDNLLTIKITKNSIVPFFADMVWLSSSSILPVMGVCMVAAIVGNVIQGGFVFSTKKLSFNFAKIFTQIGTNFMKMFWSREAAFNLLKSLAKVVGVFTVAFILLNNQLAQLMNLSRMNILESFRLIWSVIFQFVSFSGVMLLIFAIGDYAFQRFIHKESLKMSKEELRQEYKEMEGDPQIKARIREMQRRLLSRKMIQDVPKADVVITNPTHLSIAIKYDQNYMIGPTVLAKGEGPFAMKIREVAKENNVPLVENKPLAQEIYKRVDVGDMIPADLWKAVANILSVVYSMKSRNAAA